MPGLVTANPSFQTILIKSVHPSYGAEILDADFQDMSDEQFREIKAYGFLVFRNTGLSDAQRVAFSSRIGGRKLRYTDYELFDAVNVDEEGNPIDPNSLRAHYNRGNALFHVDSSFNPRRVSRSLLRAVKLPRPGMGGETKFADRRTAWDDLHGELKKSCWRGLVGAHSLLRSRKLGLPEFFADLVLESEPVMRHKILQTHEPSGRKDLYFSTHCHRLETKDCEPLPVDESAALLKKLINHITQPKYIFSANWIKEGEVIVWDNTAVMYHALGGSFEGKSVRDMRRTTVHDDSSTAWGLNIGQEGCGSNH